MTHKIHLCVAALAKHPNTFEIASVHGGFMFREEHVDHRLNIIDKLRVTVLLSVLKRCMPRTVDAVCCVVTSINQ